MQEFTTTSLVGGKVGTIFRDILFKDGDGSFVLDTSNQGTLDVNHPITNITVYHGWVVDGFDVTYQLTSGDTVTLRHGSGPATGRTTSSVTFGADEVLTGVFGLAGPQSTFRDMLNQIGFTIQNTATGVVRTAGPFGNGRNTNEGTPFYASDVIAFGGFAQDTPAVGLSGLFFYSKGGE